MAVNRGKATMTLPTDKQILNTDEPMAGVKVTMSLSLVTPLVVSSWHAT